MHLQIKENTNMKREEKKQDYHNVCAIKSEEAVVILFWRLDPRPVRGEVDIKMIYKNDAEVSRKYHHLAKTLIREAGLIEGYNPNCWNYSDWISGTSSGSNKIHENPSIVFTCLNPPDHEPKSKHQPKRIPKSTNTGLSELELKVTNTPINFPKL
ncbi:hypothetical protein YC2023_116940 [Brassica napus]